MVADRNPFVLSAIAPFSKYGIFFVMDRNSENAHHVMAHIKPNALRSDLTHLLTHLYFTMKNRG